MKEKPKVLLVDDEADKLNLLAFALQREGYEVMTASDGEAGLRAVEEHQPDLIITDVMMPGMDGYEMVRRLRSNPQTRFIPVIIQSAARVKERDVRLGYEVGAVGYITDPTNLDLLRAQARNALELRHYLNDLQAKAGQPPTPNSRNPQVNLIDKGASEESTEEQTIVPEQERAPQRLSANKPKDPYRLTGTVLSDKYELIEYAGGGGMGAVYRALRRREQDIVAIKILKPDVVARSPEYGELFEREARNASSLDHPHIVKIFDSDKYEDLSYMVMEWVAGSSIEDLITQGQIPIDWVAEIFEQVCDAVTYAHQRGIIHLDIKPSNILLLEDVKPDNFVKVIDFGLSRVISKESGTTVTKFRGTHQYCAPEQFGGKVSYRSDIYSLGATLYHLITGVIPFGMSYINAKIHPNLELPKIPSLTRQRDVPPELDTVVNRALSKNPELRQQSARQLFEEFKDALLSNGKDRDTYTNHFKYVDLQRAVEREEFLIHYQPIVALDNFQLRGFEALVRWQHPERGFISPMDFIPVAEETGLIAQIGEFALREACRQMRRWQRSVAADAHLFMSVNLSSKQFNQPDLIEQVRSILTQTRLSPRNLKLEITESAVMENIETATDMLKQLRALGVQLAIDDFGTGYSSLSYLHRFPIDTLKIDRSFVTRMSENNENTEIVRTIVVLAQNLGMDVVAEGVETKEQLVLLRRLGCENGQGYFFSKPVNSDGAEKIIAETYATIGSTGGKIVNEVRMEEAQAVIESSKPPHKTAQRQALIAEEAVLKWLWKRYPNKVRFAEFRSPIDLIVELPGGDSQGVDVKYFRHANDIHSRLRESINSLRRISKDEGYSSFLLVLVASNQDITFMLNEAVNEIDADVPQLSITVGRLTAADEFIALRTATTM